MLLKISSHRQITFLENLRPLNVDKLCQFKGDFFFILSTQNVLTFIIYQI